MNCIDTGVSHGTQGWEAAEWGSRTRKPSDTHIVTSFPFLSSPLSHPQQPYLTPGLYCLPVDHQVLCLRAVGRRWLSLNSWIFMFLHLQTHNLRLTGSLWFPSPHSWEFALVSSALPWDRQRTLVLISLLESTCVVWEEMGCLVELVVLRETRQRGHPGKPPEEG